MKNYKFRIISLLLLVQLISISCGQDEMIPREFPRVKTLPVSIIPDSDEPLLNAEITTLGEFEIIEMGFVWGREANPELESFSTLTIHLPPQNLIHEFNAPITQNLIANVNYNVRAFAKTQNKLVYGKNVSFESLINVKHKITGIDPISGIVGDTITIFGEHFSNTTNKNILTFYPLSAGPSAEKYTAKVIASTTTTLTAIVPIAPSSMLNGVRYHVGVAIVGNEVLTEILFEIH